MGAATVRPIGPRHWGPLETWTIPAQLAQRVEATPDRPFISFGSGPVLTFAETDRRARVLAAGLAGLGVVAGERVLMMVPNQQEFVDAWLAINLLGASDVSLNTAYRQGPLVHAVNLSGASVLVLAAEFLPTILEVEAQLGELRTIVLVGEPHGSIEPGSTDLRLLYAKSLDGSAGFTEPDIAAATEASVIFTSGTTGPAKGVIMPHAQGHAIARESIDGVRLTADDIFYCFHPLFHMAGKFGALLAALEAGCRIVLDTAFDPDRWLARVREYGATVSIGHGPMLEMIHARPALDDDADNPLRALICAPLPAAIAESFETRFGLRGVETWGMTEVTCASWMDIDEPVRPGSAGRAVPDLVDIRVVDPETDEELLAGIAGEIVVRPLQPWVVSPGYLNMPEKTLETWRNLWFHTGDAGYLDGDGYLYMVDRLGDRIRRRAENIASYDIEVAAGSFDRVTEVAAIGVPSGYAGDDDIKLFVAFDGPAIRWEDLFVHLVERLPHHMVPRFYEQIGALPRTPTNKVQKGLLRKQEPGTVWDYREAGMSIRQARGEA